MRSNFGLMIAGIAVALVSVTVGACAASGPPADEPASRRFTEAVTGVGR